MSSWDVGKYVEDKTVIKMCEKKRRRRVEGIFPLNNKEHLLNTTNFFKIKLCYTL